MPVSRTDRGAPMDGGPPLAWAAIPSREMYRFSTTIQYPVHAGNLDSVLPGCGPDPSWMLSVASQVFQCLLGCKLLGLFFRSAFCPSHIFRFALSLNIDARFYCEGLAMVGPFFFNRGIHRLL